MDRFSNMEVFVKVVEANSFAGAARLLNLSPASVSAHVQALETRLGVRLINRTTRSLHLTDVGQAYFQRCVRLLSDIEEADSAARDLQSSPKGVLRINSSLAFGLTHLSTALVDFMNLYPEVSVELILSTRFPDLIEEGFDVAIRAEPPPESSLIARRIAPFHVVVCAAPAYLDKMGVPQRPEDLSRYNCLTLVESVAQHEWPFAGTGGRRRLVPVSGNLRTSSVRVLVAAAVGGVGIMAAPSFAVGEELKDGRLKAVLTEHTPPGLALRALYPPGRHLSVKVRAFIDFLIERYGQDPDWDEWRRISGEVQT
jgi:DNA-binding transcriptional LysR family regulator